MLTPYERQNYLDYGVLPSRINYSFNERAYILNDDNNDSVVRNDLRKNRRENRPGYKLVPRWKYILQNLQPTNLSNKILEKGFGLLLSSFLGNIGGGEDDDDNDNEEDDDDDNGDDYLNADNDDEKDEKKYDKNDEKKDDKNDDSSVFDNILPSDATKNAVKDVLTSDITKSAIKAAALFFGGPGALAAVEAGSKLADATDVVKKMPKFK